MKNFKMKVLAVSMLAPLSMAMVGCGGGDGDEDYNEVVIEQPPVVIDMTNPELRDTKGQTDQVFLFSDNKNDGTKAYVDEVSRIALKNVTPQGADNLALDVKSISLYRAPIEGESLGGAVATADNAIGALLLDSPDLKYSAAGAVIADTENDDEVITATQLNTNANNFLNLLKTRLGNDHEVVVKSSKNDINGDGTTVTISGAIKRKDGVLGVDKYPVIQHKRMRDEMLSVLFNYPVWTKPSVASNYGTAGAESKELSFTVTSWAYKGATYLWVSTNDSANDEAVAEKFSRYNNGVDLSSAESYLELADTDPEQPPVEIDQNDPSIKDQLSRTETVYYLPKNGKGQTSGLNDNVAQVALLNLQPKGMAALAVNPDNISLYRSPKSGTEFANGVAITSSNAFGAILLDDPSLSFSGAGITSGSITSSGSQVSNELNTKANEYIGSLKSRLGAEFNVQVTNVARTDNSDGPVVNLTGSIKRNAAKDSSDPYPFLQHKRIRDEMLAVKLDRPVWTKPTLKSDFAKGGSESTEMTFNVTSWVYNGTVYLWVSANDAAQDAAVTAKYGRYNSGQDLSAVARNLVKDEVSDKGDPALLDQLSRTEQVYYFLKDSNGNTSNYIDNVSKVALMNVQPQSTPSAAINPNNVSLLRLPLGDSMLPTGVASTIDNSIGSILIDDPELLYSGAGTLIAQGEFDEANPESSDPTANELSDNANNFFNLLRYRLGSEYNVSVDNVNRYTNIDGKTVTLTGTIQRTDGQLSGAAFPVMQHKRMRDEMLASQYNRPIWSQPTLASNWGSSNSESKELAFTATTWAYKGGTYLWVSTYDKKNAAAVSTKYGRYDKGQDLAASIHALGQ